VAIARNLAFGVQSQNIATGTPTSVTVPLSPAPADQDVVVVGITLYKTAAIPTITAPAGWTLAGAVGGTVNTAGNVAVYLRRWSTGDSVAPQWTFGASVSAVVTSATAWAGVDASTPQDAAAGTADFPGTAGTTIPVTATPVTSGAHVLAFYSAPGSPLLPAEVARLLSALGSNIAQTMGYTRVTAGGAVTLTATATTSSNRCGALLLLRPAGAGATSRTWYVRPGGSDSNTGGAATTGGAWLTVGKLLGNTAVSDVLGGDVAYIAPGTYREAVTVAITPASTVTVIGDYTASQFSDLDGGEVRLTAFTTNDTTAPSSSTTLNLNGKSFLSFEGLSLVGGTSATATCVLGAASHDITLRRCAINGRTGVGSAVRFTPPADAAANLLVDGCLLTGPTGGEAIWLTPATSTTADYSLASTVRNCVFTGSATSAYGLWLSNSGAGAFAGGGLTIDHCTFLNLSNPVYFQMATDSNMRYPVLVTHCLFVGASTGVQGASASVTGSVLEDFNVFHNVANGIAGGTAGAGSVVNTYAPLLSFGQEWLFGLRPRPFLSPVAGAPQLGFANKQLAYGAAGTTASDATVGTVAWTNPGNAVLSDNVYAVATSIPASTGVSQYLKLTNWGFSLPASAVVDGIRCDWERKAQAVSSLKTNSIKLVKAGTIAGTEQLGSDTAFYSATDATFSHGGSTSLWGTTWTDAEVNASGFGVVISVKNLHATVACTASIDFVRLIVAYHTADGLGSQTVDFLNNPRPAGAASTANAVGALELGTSGVKDGSVYHTAAPSFRLDGPGYDDRALAVDATATTVTVWVRQNASYTGTKPRLQVRDGEECGVTAASVTGTAAVSTWEQLSLTFTPTRAGVVTIRVLSSTTAAAGSVNYDDFAVA
jgi:hypothetical protein